MLLSAIVADAPLRGAGVADWQLAEPPPQLEPRHYPDLSQRMRNLLWVLAFSVAWQWLAGSRAVLEAAPSPEPSFTRAVRDFPSGGTTIRVDRYEPLAPGAHPAILVLHGSGGMIFDGPEMQRVAERLARAGNAVYLIHYFNRTGTLAVAGNAGLQKHFETWLGTVRDAIGWVQSEQKSPRPVGIYGYSLGAFLALAAASDDPRVGTVAEQAGGIWNGKESRIGRMPPVLVVQGLQDQRVPNEKYARQLQAVLRRRGAAVEMRIYPQEGHRFATAPQAEVREQVAAFFARKPGDGSQSGTAR